MQNDQYGQNSQNGAHNNQYGIQNNPYPNVAYPQVQYGPAVQPAPYQQNIPYQQAPSAVNSGKSKKTAMIFCIISNVLMVLGVLAIPFLFVMILAMGFGAVGETFFMALLIAAACALGPIASLALAIAAKVKNRKSIWAVVNMVLSTILIMAPVALGIVYVNDRKNNPKPVSQTEECWYILNEHPYYDEMKSCLEEHDFDDTMIDNSGRRMASCNYIIRIYVSTESSEEKRSEVNEYLRQLRDICIKTDEMGIYPEGMSFTIWFFYFDPDIDKKVYSAVDIPDISADTPDDEIDVDKYIDNALSGGLVPGIIWDKLGNANVQVIIY